MMMKKYIRNIFLILTLFCAMFAMAEPCFAGKYEKRLSKEDKKILCDQLKSQQKKSIQGASSLGGGIIPDNVLISIYNTTKKISDKTALLLTLGHSLTCHAVHAGKNSISAAGVTFFSYPDFSVWTCGAIVYFVGFMLTVSISFYVADIAFKLGFAVIMLPVAFALWPFPVTKDKLSIIISIILKNAAIFTFLAITVAYTLSLVDAATNSTMHDEITSDAEIFETIKKEAAKYDITWDKLGGMEKIFFMITNNMTDVISKNFTVFSTYFLVIMFSLIYGMKLISSTITDYVDKFFPDKAFGNETPIHKSMTQGVDFLKKKAVAPVMSFAADVAKTQTGKVVQGAGKLMAGKYNDSIRNLAKNPANVTSSIAGAVHKFGGNVAKAGTTVLTGTIGRLALGGQASKDLQRKINEKIDQGTAALDKKAGNVATALNELAHKRNDKNTERRRERREKFMNSKLGKAYQAALAKHSELQEKYENKLNELHEQRDNIDADIDDQIREDREDLNGISSKTQKEQAIEALKSKYNVDSIENDAVGYHEYKQVEGAAKAIGLRTNRIIQAMNQSRENLYELDGREALAKIDEIKGLKKRSSDNGVQKFVRATGRFALKAPVAIKSATTKLYTGVDKIKALQTKEDDNGFTKTLKLAGRTILKAPTSVLAAATGGAKAVRDDIDSIAALQVNEGDGAVKTALKNVGKAILKAPTGLVDKAHRAVTATTGVALNTVVATGGGIGRLAANVATGIKTLPANIKRTAKKAPSALLEGGLRAINVTKNAKHVGKALRGTWNAVGEVLDKTGDQMQRNKKSEAELEAERRQAAAEEELRRKKELAEEEQRRNS